MAGIRIPFLAEVRDFLRGTSDVESALDDVSDALDDVSDNGRATGADVARYLTDGAEKAEQAADEAGRSFRTAFDTLRREANVAADDTSNSVKKGFDDAGEASATFKDETRQNLSESVSSFRGDVEDIPQLLQDVLGGVSADLGAIGGLAAAGGAALIGTTIAQLQAMADRINEAKEEAAALAAEIVETGQGLEGVDLAAKLREWSLAIGDARSWWELWQSDAVTNIELVSQAADRVGEDVGAMYAAMASGDLDDARTLLDRYREAQQALHDEAVAGTSVISGHGTVMTDAAASAADTAQAYDGVITPLQEWIAKTEEAEALARELTAAEHGVTEAVVEQAEALAATTEAQAALAEERASALDQARDLFEAEGAYAETLTKTTEAIGTNTDGLSVNTEQGLANRDALLDLSGAALAQAEAMAQAGASADEVSGFMDAARGDFLAAAAAAGVETTEAQRLADALLGVPGQVATDVTTTARAAQSDVSDYIATVQSTPTQRTTIFDAAVRGIDEARRQLDALALARTVALSVVLPGVPGVRRGQRADI